MVAAWPALLVAAHVLGACLWVGGQLVLAPVTRALRGDRERMREAARRAQPLLWGGLALAALSGLGLLSLRGWSALVAWKVALTILAAAGAAVHVLSPRRGWPRWLTGAGAALALLSGLVLVALGAALRWS